MRVQSVPFQCKMRPCWPALSDSSPAAHTFEVEVAATLRSSPPVPWTGASSCVQAVPFQCRIKGEPGCWPPELPTAQALVAETAVTASSLLLAPGAGLGTWAQRVPFQCRIRLLLAPDGPRL